MTLIKVYNDIHNEMGKNPFSPPECDTDLDTVLLLPGDLHTKGRSKEYCESIAHRFKAVVWVPGNHCYWGTTINKENIAEKFVSDLPNVHCLEFIDDFVTIDNLEICGATLWTDQNQKDWLSAHYASTAMNDFKRIKFLRHGAYIKWSVEDWVERNLAARKKISTFLSRPPSGKTRIVMSHHAPTYESIGEVFRTPSNQYINFSYHNTKLEETVALADLWVHGHNHNTSDYMVDTCRVICNPRGYERYEENPEFDVNGFLSDW